MGLIKLIESIDDTIVKRGVDEKIIYLAEEKLEVVFSNEYREYLKEYGAVAINGHELTGVINCARINVVEVTEVMRGMFKEISRGWYVVEQANIDGIVIWQDKDGSVYQTMPNQRPVRIADSLSEYLRCF